MDAVAYNVSIVAIVTDSVASTLCIGGATDLRRMSDGSDGIEVD